MNNNISSFKDTNNSTNPNLFQSETKNSLSNNLINTNIPLNYNLNPNLNSKNYSDNLTKNKTLEEENIELMQQNKILKEKFEEIYLKKESDKNNEQFKNEINKLKQKISEYESIIEETKIKYKEQIENYTIQIKEYNTYIHLSYIFFNNLAKNAITNLNFDLSKNNLILISIDEFKQKLNQIENFIYDILKENSNMKIKYHKLLEMNNQLCNNYENERNNNSEQDVNNNNYINDSFHTSSSNFNTINKTPENVFENNYDNISIIKKPDINIFDRKDSNNIQQQGTLEIYKTLEQRVNMLEKELNIQKNYHNNINQNNKNYCSLNTKNDILIKKVRSKSGNKIHNKQISSNSDYSQNENPYFDKPKKNIKKKKKKKTHIKNNGSNDESLNNKNCKGSNKNIIEKNNTPLQNKKYNHLGVNLKNINIKQKKY